MSPSSAYFVSHLRHELCVRNRAYALDHRLAHVESYGSMPVIVYQPEEGRHGNFLDETYAAILSNPEWSRRLEKVHAQARSALPKSERRWRELDSCTSSDALLMNVFCCPGVLDDSRVLSLLGVDSIGGAEFGFKARVPLSSGRFDRTEVDLKLGDLLIEAKLTEADFQAKDAEVVRGYRDFKKVFDARELPQAQGKFLGYQLIRNVLAAHANACSFCVLLEQRRPDLIEQWYAVMRCVRIANLRLRCKMLTWQELSETLAEPLQAFLDCKYGIAPPGQSPGMSISAKDFGAEE
jgi:Restriction Endonuclease associating with ARP